MLELLELDDALLELELDDDVPVEELDEALLLLDAELLEDDVALELLLEEDVPVDDVALLEALEALDDVVPVALDELDESVPEPLDADDVSLAPLEPVDVAPESLVLEGVSGESTVATQPPSTTTRIAIGTRMRSILRPLAKQRQADESLRLGPKVCHFRGPWR
ncbi:MAG: hypothetical protein JST54_30085 [Deltaproteobacteria bacterium]|nr:hypothetical protein [Deltaproteobacteria bacterium]